MFTKIAFFVVIVFVIANVLSGQRSQERGRAYAATSEGKSQIQQAQELNDITRKGSVNALVKLPDGRVEVQDTAAYKQWKEKWNFKESTDDDDPEAIPHTCGRVGLSKC